ncbi:MAG: sigma-54 dependent transcriptional regulator [Anaerovoracaceae bacterium]
MNIEYGQDRVIEPKQLLPTTAWKLDNQREIKKHEMRVSLRRLHIEGTSFRQICLDVNNKDELIKEKIIDIVERRGKLHNPVTDTGGLAYGVVEAIGADYINAEGIEVGDTVICNASLTSMPLYISKIEGIDHAYNQVDVSGYAILYNNITVVKSHGVLPVNLLLYAFNESGTLYKASELSKGKERFLIVGNNLLVNILYGYTIRRTVGRNATIVNILDKKTNTVIMDGKIDALIENVFDEIRYENILHPLEVVEKFNHDELFDLTINCADIPGAETINILATKNGGEVLFANLINNYNIALYITESIGRSLRLHCAEGYVDGYDDFDVDIVRELAPYFEGTAVITNQSRRKAQRVMKQADYRKFLFEDFISESRAMEMVLDEIMNVSKYDCNVMLTGDTGVGKDKVAHIIQKNSSRNMQTFIKINCASIAPNLMESEFFGYESGSFTGAKTGGKKGYFETADNGIVFLDEVGELPLDMQAKLLRVIQDGEFFRVGGATPVKTNVRIISATNRDLDEFVEKKLFRSDLYYRLNVFPIKVPSLKERKDDIPALVSHFITKYSEKFGIERGIEEDAITYLQQSDWPGNIRELENVVQRLLIGARGEDITVMDVMKELNGDIFAKTTSFRIPDNLDETGVQLDLLVENFEKDIIKTVYEKCGSTRKAAKALGISQTQMVRKKNKYEIETKKDFE